MDIALSQEVDQDVYTDYVKKAYDLNFNRSITTTIKNDLLIPSEYNIGLIYGSSGSGKSTILRSLGEIFTPVWSDTKSIISDLNCKSPELASELLCSVGLSDVPSWLRSYKNLSTGQKFRADLAKSINTNNLALIDEYSSTVDRNVAKAASFALQKFIRKRNKKIILSSCHADIIDWLMPDWIYYVEEAKTLATRERLRRPQIELRVCRAKYEAWNLFKSHHYLTQSLNKNCKIFLFFYGASPVAISCVMNLPHASIKNAWRESRLVVLPDYQGLGIGCSVSNYIGSLVRARGGRFYSRTSHPSMISYRERNPSLWRFCSKGKSSEQSESSTTSKYVHHINRYCYSHEYIGPTSNEKDSEIFWVRNCELDKINV